MDVFYEESSIPKASVKESRKYKILQIVSYIFLTIGILMLFWGYMFVPVDAWIGWAIFCAWFFLIWFVCAKLKKRFNVSYDYTFVSGELRIIKVLNINKRKLVTRINCDEILQIGDAENSAFERLQSSPDSKNVVCTSNIEPTEGKFFMYILINENGKKLYLLECREELLVNIMRFAKRSVLESDYVSQSKKQKV